jgi:hypothetical protein
MVFWGWSGMGICVAGVAYLNGDAGVAIAGLVVAAGAGIAAIRVRGQKATARSWTRIVDGTSAEVLPEFVRVLEDMGCAIRGTNAEDGVVRFTTKPSLIAWLGQDLQAKIEQEDAGQVSVILGGVSADQRWGRGQGGDLGTSERFARRMFERLRHGDSKEQRPS